MLSQKKKLSSATDFVYQKERGDFTGMYQRIQSLISDGKTHELLRIIAFQRCNSQILLDKIKLTRKQYYSRILRLAETGLIRRNKGEYYLTSLGKVVCKYMMGIENAVHNYWKLKAVDTLETSDQLPIEERKKLMGDLIENSEIRDILIKNEWLYSSTNIGNRIQTPRVVIEKQQQQQKKLSPKIMLVEDETDVLLTYKSILNTEGYDVEAFTSPYEALKNFLTKNHPYYDLIIIDIGSGINGLQLYQKFKSIDDLVKILFITALDAAAEIVSILPDVRLSDIIRKPVEQERFVNVVTTTLAEAAFSRYM